MAKVCGLCDQPAYLHRPRAGLEILCQACHAFFIGSELVEIVVVGDRLEGGQRVAQLVGLRLGAGRRTCRLGGGCLGLAAGSQCQRARSQPAQLDELAAVQVQVLRGDL